MQTTQVVLTVSTFTIFLRVATKNPPVSSSWGTQRKHRSERWRGSGNADDEMSGVPRMSYRGENLWKVSKPRGIVKIQDLRSRKLTKMHPLLLLLGWREERLPDLPREV